MAEEWWDPNGKFKTLHKFNPVRIAFIREKIITAGQDTDAADFGRSKKIK